MSDKIEVNPCSAGRFGDLIYNPYNYQATVTNENGTNTGYGATKEEAINNALNK